jgi:nucleoside-diphosphate-sugar epimerase
MAHYLVTGAAGFIATRVSEMLLGAGNSILGLDNMNDAYDVRMKEYRLQRLQRHSNFSFQQLDISNRTGLADTIQEHSLSNGQFDAVINLAARAGVRQSVKDPWGFLDTNVTGTLNLLELCRQHGIGKFILASTSSIYGANAPQPTPEKADSNHPLQAYAASKKSAEVLCHAYHYLYGIDVTIFRYFTVFGPAGRPDMSVYRFIHWITEGLPVKVNGDGQQSRGYTYVDDIARGTILGLRPLGYEIINLGGHETITISDLIHLLEGQTGRKAHIEYHSANLADMRENWADVEKAGRLLGWEPQVNLREGIANAIAWYNMERNWASKIKVE